MQNRKSVLAIKKEVTEGVPVAPTASTDFVALQTGFTMTPAFETLDSDEIRSSIGKTKPILGLEQPTGSFSHYLRHSGVEGQAPDFELLTETAFGAKTVNGTERSTSASSTVSSLKVSSGASDFRRGMAVMIKDPVNGTKIRPVKGVSGSDVALSFQLPAGAAPGTGVKLGKCVNFSPADEGQPTLSAWLYRANGGVTEMVAGMRVSSYTLDIAAGQMINQAFQLEGTAYYMNPIQIELDETKLDFNDGTTDYVATVAARMYKDPHDLAAALQVAMNGLGSADEFTVSYNDRGVNAGRFTIKTDGTTLVLKLSTGPNTATSVGPKMGFSTSADLTGAATYSSDSAQSYAAPFVPEYDTASPLVAKNNEIFLGDETDSLPIQGVQSVNFSLGNSLATIPDIGEESGVAGKTATSREATMQIRARLDKHDADKFRRYRTGEKISASYNFGVKAGGNWIPGRCGNLYMPDGVISAFNVGDQDGIAVLEMTITAYVNDKGEGEAYLSFV